jgi:hypothetical protein
LLLALLSQRQVDWVVRLHQSRHPDFRRGVCRGINDLVVEWKRPERPEWMDEATYASIPERMQVREIRVRIDEPGFRPDEIVVVTSLHDTERYPMQAVAELYHYRWYVELDILAIKQFTGMNHLRCRSPEMIRKELWVHWLTYNLTRKSIAQAAMLHGRLPRRISYTGAQQALVASWDRLTTSCGEEGLALARTQLRVIAQHVVPDRPGRVEPRAIKSVPSHFPRLTEPRSQARQKLCCRWALR